MAHKHSIYDTDPHFIIDKNSRQVKNASETKTVVFQNDHNSERFTFELPRYVDGHDMTLCDIVQVHYVNSSSTSKDSTADVYSVEDLQVSPDSEDVAICSWLISSNATKYAGSLTFALVFKCTNQNDPSKFDYVWHTAIHSGVSIAATINNSNMFA